MRVWTHIPICLLWATAPKSAWFSNYLVVLSELFLSHSVPVASQGAQFSVSGQLLGADPHTLQGCTELHKDLLWHAPTDPLPPWDPRVPFSVIRPASRGSMNPALVPPAANTPLFGATGWVNTERKQTQPEFALSLGATARLKTDSLFPPGFGFCSSQYGLCHNCPGTAWWLELRQTEDRGEHEVPTLPLCLECPVPFSSQAEGFSWTSLHLSLIPTSRSAERCWGER